jgi:hypothetical protein
MARALRCALCIAAVGILARLRLDGQVASTSVGAAKERYLTARIFPTGNAAKDSATFLLLGTIAQPVELKIGKGANLGDVLRRRCGGARQEIVARLKELNPGLSYPIAQASGVVVMPPCPYWRENVTVVVSPGSTLTDTLLLHMGTAGPNTQEAVLRLNSALKNDPDLVKPNQSLRLPYVTKASSYRLQKKPPEAINQLAEELRSQPGVIANAAAVRPQVSLVRRLSPASSRGDRDFCVPPRVKAAWPFDTAELEAQLRRNDGLRGRPPTHAVVLIADTGVDENEKRLFYEYNAKERKGSPGEDNDNNGYIYDVIGVDITSSTGGFPRAPKGFEDAKHGTHVAALALGGLASKPLNDLVAGRMGLTILNLVHTDTVADSPPHITFSIPTAALTEVMSYHYGGRQPPAVINLSWESLTAIPGFASLLQATSAVVVVAAGNDSRDLNADAIYPAYYRRTYPRNMIVVGAHDATNGLTEFSNRGKDVVDLLAPGCKVRSAVPGNGWEEISGTSQAAPLVAFTAGLLWSEGLSDAPAIKQRIIDTVDVKVSLASAVVSAGRLNIARALAIFDDIVVTEKRALVGRVKNASLSLCGDNIQVSKIHRIMPAYGVGAKPLRVWIEQPGGFVEPKDCAPSTATIQLVLDGNTLRPIPLSEVSDFVPHIFESP